MNKVIGLILSISIVAASFSVLTSCSSYNQLQSGQTLNIFNWGQYIADGEDETRDLIAEFEEHTGIKVNYETFDSNESMYAKLKLGGSNYDLIIPSDYMAERLIKEGMLEKIDYSNIPNYSNIDDSYKNLSYDPTNEYTVPYTVGYVGIIYNTKYVTDEITGWESLWDSKYKDKILMFRNSRDAFSIAQSYIGVDANTTNHEELVKAGEKLLEQKPYVQEYVMDQIFDKMINEVAWIAPYYAGDYLYMLESNENLAFCLPEQGFNRFVDCMCVPKDSKNKTNAELFMNFILDKDIQFANIDYIGYSSPFKRELIPEEYLNDISYPSDDKLKKSFMFEHLSDEALKYIDGLWIDVRIAPNK